MPFFIANNFRLNRDVTYWFSLRKQKKIGTIFSRAWAHHQIAIFLNHNNGKEWKKLSLIAEGIVVRKPNHFTFIVVIEQQ